MPLTADNFIQEASGVVTTPSLSWPVALPNPTTAGNTIVVVLGWGATATSVAPPANFDHAVANIPLMVYYRSEVPAGETSWPFQPNVADFCSWWAAEVSNLDPVEPVDTADATSGLVGNGETFSAGTTALNVGLSAMSLAAFHTVQGSAETSTWSGYTDGFESVVEVDPAGSTGVNLAAARKFQQGFTSHFTTTGSFTTSGPSETVYGVVVVFHAADSAIVAPLHTFVGMEWGTHGGAASSTGSTRLFGGNAPSGTWGTSYEVRAGSARTSSYGLRIVQSANVGWVKVGVFPENVRMGSYGLNVRVVSATGTVVVAEVVNPSTLTRGQLLYDSATTKFGVRAGSTGTVSWQSGTTALNTWAWIDLRVKTNSPTWSVDWRLETAADTYTDQTSAQLGGQTSFQLSSLLLGGNTSQTMTADYDDIVTSTSYSGYPLGPHQVHLLTVDPAGAPSVSGTAGNFAVFTNNGTLNSWNSTNARNAVDDAPPVVSSSADGVCQTETAASEYMEFPMSTYTSTATEAIAGVRMLAAMWGGAGSGTGTIGINAWDGTTEVTLVPASASYDPGSPTALSSTAPWWECAMWPSENGWTQAELDAAVLRVGYSTDAEPDMGVHAIYLEVAVGPTRHQALFGEVASLEVDLNRGGAVSVTVDAPAGVDTSVTYEVGGSPTTMNVLGGSSDTDQINAVFEPDVNYISGETEAEPAPVD